LSINEAAVDADLRAAVGTVELAADDAVVRVWTGFLDHAARPLDFGERFNGDKDNDLVAFVAEQRHGEVVVQLSRRIGVVEGEDYEGTIVASCRLVLVPTPAWETVPDRVTVDEYGITAGGLDDFRRQVEASAAFAAMTLSPVTGLKVIARFG
jgi:hypothetical protein